jgi:flagellar hook-length control protein FliK
MDRIDVNPAAGSYWMETALRDHYTTEGLLNSQELFDLFLERAQSPSGGPTPQSPPCNTPSDPPATARIEPDYRSQYPTAAASGGTSPPASPQRPAERPAQDETARHDPSRNPNHSTDQEDAEKRGADRDSVSPKTSKDSEMPAAASAPGQLSPKALVGAHAPAGPVPAEVATSPGASPADAQKAKTAVTVASGKKKTLPSEKQAEDKAAPELIRKAESSPTDENAVGKSQKHKPAVSKVSPQETAPSGDGETGARGARTGDNASSRPVALEAEEKTSRRETRYMKKESSRPAATASPLTAQPAKAVSTGPASSAAPAPQVALSAARQTESAPEIATPAGDAATPATQSAGLTRQGGTSAVKVSGKAGKTDGAETQPTMDRVRFVQRVERAFAAVGNRGGSIRLRLNPPELGSLQLEITVRKGVMKARVETETPAAKNLLMDNLSLLRDRLAQQDIQVQQFDVELMDRGQGGFTGQNATQADSGGSQDGSPQSQSAPAENAADSASFTHARPRPGDKTQLDVVV